MPAKKTPTAYQVFAIAEILEQILLHLTMYDISEAVRAFRPFCDILVEFSKVYEAWEIIASI